MRSGLSAVLCPLVRRHSPAAPPPQDRRRQRPGPAEPAPKSTPAFALPRRFELGVGQNAILQAEAFREIAGVTYCNDGDWVESLSALAEEPDGTLWVGTYDAGLERLDPRTGAVIALASSPTFSLQQAITDFTAIPTEGGPLLDRATAGRSRAPAPGAGCASTGAPPRTP